MVTKRTTTTVTEEISEPTEPVFQPSSFATLIGQRLDTVEAAIHANFSGNIKIYRPGQEPDDNTPGLQIFVDEQNIITKVRGK